ncbi:unnamed protein product [Rotaria socialis]|uniref:G protein-coupled receptor n=1 Tax=Rotaria socialis TaxID=392032 RepID=A0A821B315_9BILA|nr:unnamed protein product [Rotaria socialis]
MYDGGVLFMAWTAFERHIIVFHEQWISTKKRRIIIHYLPMLFLILYIFIYYTYAIYYFPCENTYDYTLPYCNDFPCYTYNPIMDIYDWIANITSPTFLEALLSLAFIFRVLWQKHHFHLPMHWRKHRKMTIQLMSLSSLNMAFNMPLCIINIAYFCGLPNDIVAEMTHYRVQKFLDNSLTSDGITVAGGHGHGSEPNQLKSPVDVYVDDSSNHRIQMWPIGATIGITVVDTEGTGEYENRVGYFHKRKDFAEAKEMSIEEQINSLRNKLKWN